MNYRARDPNLKPDVGERQKLTKIIDSPIPINGLSEESKNLLFKFGHTSFLTGNKKALTRFLYCIDWNMQDEVNQVVDLLQTWVTIDIDDAQTILIGKYSLSPFQRGEDIIPYPQNTYRGQRTENRKIQIPTLWLLMRRLHRCPWQTGRQRLR